MWCAAKSRCRKRQGSILLRCEHPCNPRARDPRHDETRECCACTLVVAVCCGVSLGSIWRLCGVLWLWVGTVGGGKSCSPRTFSRIYFFTVIAHTRRLQYGAMRSMLDASGHSRAVYIYALLSGDALAERCSGKMGAEKRKYLSNFIIIITTQHHSRVEPSKPTVEHIEVMTPQVFNSQST